MGAEGIPVILISSAGNHIFYLIQIILHFSIVLHPQIGVSLRRQSVTTPFCSITLAYRAVSPVAIMA